LVPNLFLATRPSPEAAAAGTALADWIRRDHQLRGNLVKLENLHVTLVEFFKLTEREETVLEKVSAAAKRVDLAPFEVNFDRAMSFRVRKDEAVVLTGSDGVTGLVTLQRDLIGALHKEWLKIPPNPRYTPHMTLLYADRAIPEISVRPLRWTATEFVFIRSLPGKSTHVVLDRWPLRG